MRAHFRAALDSGRPRVLVVNRPEADGRRDRLMRKYDTQPGATRRVSTRCTRLRYVFA